MTPDVEHRFGSNTWTEEKLKIVFKFIDTYTTALKEQKWKLFYIDAFAGTGSREWDDDEGVTQSSPGSVLNALETSIPFHKYYFIEMDPAKATELESKISVKGAKSCKVWRGDANAILPEIIRSMNPAQHRGVVFLDPFAMSVGWPTLEAIANSTFLDLWFLVPFGAIARVLPREGTIQEGWRSKLIQTFGEDPVPSLYVDDQQPALPMELEEFGIDSDRKIRKGGPKALGKYIVKRLDSIFAWVCKDIVVLKNSNNSPMFLLVYAISNKSDAAKSLADRISKSILKKHLEEGGHVQRFCD